MCFRLLQSKSKTSPIRVPTLSFIRSTLQKEYLLFSDKSTWIETWKGKSHDPLVFWDEQKTLFPYLSLLSINLLKIEVTNANVERSMKSLGSIVNPKINQLSLLKVNEVILIKFNNKAAIKNQNRHFRLSNRFDKFEAL